MAETILRNVLNKKISIDALFQWLTSENLEETICSDIVQNGSTRADFVSYFLNYLRQQSESILPDSKEVQEKLPKKTSNVSQNLQGLPRRTSLFHRPNKPAICNNSSNSPHGDQRRAVMMSPNHPGQIPGRISGQIAGQIPGQIPGQMTGHIPWRMGGQITGQMTIPDQMQMNYPQLSGQVGLLNSSLPNPNSMAQGIHQSPPNSGDGQYPQNQICGNVNPMQSPQFPRDPGSPYNSPNVNYGAVNFAVNQAQTQLASLNLSSPSGIFENSVSNLSLEMGSPQPFGILMRNESILNAPFSPPSPLYANNVSTLCPRRAEKSPNETTTNSQNCSVNSPNVSRTSTPKNTPISEQKMVKPGQNQSLCLGDYIKPECSQGSKKSSKNKSRERAQQYRKLQGAANSPADEKQSPASEPSSQGSKKSSKNKSRERAQQYRKLQGAANSPADEKQSHASGAKSKRRINPTRLDVASGKESPGKEVFGVISRPTVVNPKFVEAPSTDKSQEEVSFEVERGLLKLERQRQPKNESATETANTEPKLASKTKLESTVVPCVDLVENVEALNTLANLYSGILHRNLMSNPMTELYFLVTLLTTQYKTLSKKKSTNSGVNTEKTPSSVRLLESLKSDLGCAELNDDISTEIVEENSPNSDEESGDKLANNEPEESSILNDSVSSEEKSSNKLEEYLGTAHNCVYFATMVMLNQQFLLSTLDRATLKLLCENHQINAFQPQLLKYLNKLYRDKCLQTKTMKQIDSRSLQTNVCFQVDTDNRETFPSASAFGLFRKQRDLFYDILREWEEKHLTPDWSFQRALKNKITTLLTLHTDAVNYCHFAKLFVSQLIVSSIQNGQTEDPMDDESLSILKSLKHVNPEKLIQLKERLVTPLTSTGPVPKPMFPGVQEFYKEFILSISDWKFYVILETTFIREIMELNDTQFAGSEIEGTETTVDENTKQSFITCVSSLRLLAKFASFTLSLPFATASNSPEWLVSQIQLRGRVLPSLDLQNCLLDALINGRLSLTVPWIVQYMSMLDTVALRLPYYMKIGEQLYCIYRISSQLHPGNWMSPQTAILMMFTIGWLFELPSFPRDVYTYWQINYDDKKLRLLRPLHDQRPQKRPQNIRSVNAKSSKEFAERRLILDKLDIIDDRALYECCPFLAEFKTLLISGNAVLGNTNANRHITPVSSQLSQPTFGAKTKNLQMQLEEAFFHGQPSSIRKTVDFVSERVASSCVKYICNSIIPSTKQRNMDSFLKPENRGSEDTANIISALKYCPRDDKEDEEKSQKTPGTSSTQTEKRSRSAERQMQLLATRIKDAVKKECEEKISKMCEDRTTKSIESLLADDAFPSVKETCAAIAKRMAMQRIDEWIELHVTETLFLKNMPFELRKSLKEGDVNQVEKENRHNPEVPCPTEAIALLRNSMWELVENKGRWVQLSLDAVKNTLTCLRQVLTERADLVNYAERNLYGMSVEFCLLLLTKRQDLFSTEIQQMFIDIWKINDENRGGETESLFVRIISPRNIRLLTHNSKKTNLKVFGRLLKALLKEELLSIDALSDQCVALFRQEWPETILKQLSQCLNEVVSDYKSSSIHAEAVKNLLVWIAATCEDMDICDYD